MVSVAFVTIGLAVPLVNVGRVNSLSAVAIVFGVPTLSLFMPRLTMASHFILIGLGGANLFDPLRLCPLEAFHRHWRSSLAV
jgi:hypothetical protein